MTEHYQHSPDAMLALPSEAVVLVALYLAVYPALATGLAGEGARVFALHQLNRGQYRSKRVA